MTFHIYVENLYLGSLRSVLRDLVLLSRKHSSSLSIFYIDGTPIAIRLIQWVCKLKGWNLSLLSFKLLDIREEESGDFIRLCIQTDYLWKVKDSILKKYPNFLPTGEENKFRSFLEKSIVCESLFDPRSLARTLYFVHIIRQKMKAQGTKESSLFLLTQPWGEVMREYAKPFGIQLIYIKHLYPIRWPQLSFYFSWRTLFKQWGKQIILTYFPKAIYWLQYGFFFFHKKTIVKKTSSLKIAVYPQSQWHFDNDGFNSEIFLNLQSSLPNQSLLIPLPTISAHLHSQLCKLHISTCVVNRVPPSKIKTTFFLGSANISESLSLDLSELPPLEKRQLHYLSAEYNYLKSYWKVFFREHQVKVYTSWHKNGASHIPIGEALNELGGIMTVWQRSYEEIPEIALITHTDISFGFSPRLVQTEKIQGSKIKYHVATGFIKDYNQKLLRPKSIHIRKKLMSKGAKKIVSVFDENSIDDSRWHTGHELPRKHYGFWSEKVLQEPWLGVIFKPKKPRTLRHRLGDVNFLVTEAEKTGRLVILEEASENASIIPPVLAAMASDIAIQGHFFAGTTALECALAGVPSLAVDYEGWKRSFRYQLGEGKVIFPNNENLWDVLMEHWNSENGVPGLGDWSPIINDLDPFRDGRAAERMGNYLHWLIQGFEQGLDRDTIMADAAERYCKQWGSDKISPVN
jgi:hypothetical protein